MIEQDTRYIIDSNLSNKGWILDISNPKKNVFFETDINRILDNPKLRKSKLKPDYVLVDSNRKPIGVIEAKAGGKNLDVALEQATEYADILQAPLIFAMNNSYCQTKYLYTNEPLFINDNEVNELIKQTEASKFLQENTNAIYTVPKEIILSRQELINIFRDLNNRLRAEGLRAGIERLTEFANILFLKLYTENADDNIWNNLKNSDNEMIISTFNNSLKHIDQKYGSGVYTETLISNPNTLKDIIIKLDKLSLSSINTDVKGDAFEYFLRQATATENDLGEYFTPRHIVKTLVNLVNPRFKETVYDPFCGTGGFLTESFKHIQENTIISSDQDIKLLKENTIYGGELTNNSRLAKMNMILHGDGNSGVKKIDSLANPIENKYDVIITNIPFSQNTEYSHLYFNNLANNQTDSVCILHCLKAIKKGGRLALIVPEGFLFDNKYKKVRNFLLDNAVLRLNISLPQGVFLPYTNAKTNILYFTDCYTKKTKDSILFFDVKHDGYSLDNHRTKIKKNDLKKIEYLNLNKATNSEDINSLGFYSILLEEIIKNNYNLVSSKYIKNTYKSKYQLIKLAELVFLLRGPFGSSIKKSICVEKGYKLYEQGNIIKNNFIIGSYYLNQETFEKLKKFEIQENDILMTCAGTLGKVAIVPHDFEKGIINSVLMRFRIKDTSMILPNYLKIVFESNIFQNEIFNNSLGTGIKNMRPGRELKDLLIPLPSLQTQQQIIDNYTAMLNKITEKNNEIIKINESIDNAINSIWSIDTQEPISDKLMFDTMISKASKPIVE